MATVVHHKAALDGAALPPNSLAAIRACLDAGAAWIEIDVLALAADDYLLVHDADLAHETNGVGNVATCSPAHARTLRIRGTAHTVPLLSEVVALLQSHAGTTQLQVDYKNTAPFADDEPLVRLARILEPLGSRALVSSVADWHLRRLRRIAPWLRIGFDIQAHLDLATPELGRFPQQLGTYGYLDDHPLAAQRVWSAAAYLEDRFATLVQLVAGAEVFYVRHALLARALADGFNAAAFLHAHGVQLDAWTMDVGNAAAERNLGPLVTAGVDLFTSNTPHELAKKLAGWISDASDEVLN